MQEQLIYFGIFLILAYIFILMVLRAVYFTFVLKKEPLESLNIVPKIRFKVKKGSLLDKAKQEERKEKMSRWA